MVSVQDCFPASATPEDTATTVALLQLMPALTSLSLHPLVCAPGDLPPLPLLRRIEFRHGHWEHEIGTNGLLFAPLAVRCPLVETVNACVSLQDCLSEFPPFLKLQRLELNVAVVAPVLESDFLSRFPLLQHLVLRFTLSSHYYLPLDRLSRLCPQLRTLCLELPCAPGPIRFQAVVHFLSEMPRLHSFGLSSPIIDFPRDAEVAVGALLPALRRMSALNLRAEVAGARSQHVDPFRPQTQTHVEEFHALVAQRVPWCAVRVIVDCVHDALTE